jgi:hypothetical protein
VSAAPRLTAGDITALDRILQAIAGWLDDATPAARAELKACLRRIGTWPWTEDLGIAVVFCSILLHQRREEGGPR